CQPTERDCRPLPGRRAVPSTPRCPATSPGPAAPRDWCVATHASDLAVAFVAAEAQVHVQGPSGESTELLETFYRGPDSTPKIETSLQQGDLIVAVSVPLVPGGAQSTYLKLRERASY